MCLHVKKWVQNRQLWALTAEPFISPPTLEPPEVEALQFKPHARWKMNTPTVISHVGKRPQTEIGKQPGPGISRYPDHKSDTHKGKLVTERLWLCAGTKENRVHSSFLQQGERETSYLGIRSSSSSSRKEFLTVGIDQRGFTSWVHSGTASGHVVPGRGSNRAASFSSL